MATTDRGQVRQDILNLLAGLRQEVMEGSLKLYREHLAQDAVVLAMDRPRVYKGKEACLEYFRDAAAGSRLRDMKGEVEDFKFIGDDLAIVIESYVTLYDVDGETFRDQSRATSVVVRGEKRWYLTHLHLESQSSNRIIA